MKTAEANNTPLTGKIEIPRIPNNEFTNDVGGFPSMDMLCQEHGKLYKKIQCIQCSKTWWRKKTDPALSDLCHDCRKENMQRLLEQNKDNL